MRWNWAYWRRRLKTHTWKSVSTSKYRCHLKFSTIHVAEGRLKTARHRLRAPHLNINSNFNHQRLAEGMPSSHGSWAHILNLRARLRELFFEGCVHEPSRQWKFTSRAGYDLLLILGVNGFLVLRRLRPSSCMMDWRRLPLAWWIEEDFLWPWDWRRLPLAPDV